MPVVDSHLRSGFLGWINYIGLALCGHVNLHVHIHIYVYTYAHVSTCCVSSVYIYILCVYYTCLHMLCMGFPWPPASVLGTRDAFP